MSTLETTVFKWYLETTIFCTDDNSSWIFCFIVYLVYNFCIISHNDLMIFVFFYSNVIVLQIKIMICFFLFGLPGVMIIVKLWVHTSVKWKLSWGWESHCVVSISRDPNSSSNLSKFSWGLRRLRPQTSQICPINPTSVPKSPTVTLSNIWWEDI